MKNKKYFKKILSLTLCISLLFTGIKISDKPVNAEQTSWKYEYTGNIQTWHAPKKGKYQIQMKAGNGGGFNSANGASLAGYVNLEKDDALYIAVGENGKFGKDGASGGWNGGGNSSHKGGSGGGATHVATKLIGDGQLKNYEGHLDSILAVAGGAGGASWYDGSIVATESVDYRPGEYYDLEQYGDYSWIEHLYWTNQLNIPQIHTAYHWARIYDARLNSHGGIEKGGNSEVDSNGNTPSGYATGATQESGYAFGQGEAANAIENKGYTGAGGGGLYGGKSVDTSAYMSASGGGGSGYISDDFFDTSDIYLGLSPFVSITYIPQYSTLTLKLNGHGSYDGQTGAIEIIGDIGDVIDLSKIVPDEDYTVTGLGLEFGDGELIGDKYTFGIKDSCINVSYRAKVDVNYKVYNDEVMFFEANVADNTNKTFELYKSIDNNDYSLMNESEYNYLNGRSRTWEYTGDKQIFDVEYPGIYRLRAAGGGGSGSPGQPNRGSIAQGEVYLDEGERLYVYVGARANRFNGGGQGGGRTQNSLATHAYSTNGSGATDFRLIPSTASDKWSGNESLLSRLVTAGGGGGAARSVGRSHNNWKRLDSFEDTTWRLPRTTTEASNGVLGQGSSDIYDAVFFHELWAYNNDPVTGELVWMCTDGDGGVGDDRNRGGGDQGYGVSGGGGGGWYGGLTQTGVRTGTRQVYYYQFASNPGAYPGWMWVNGNRMMGCVTYSYAGTSHIQNGYVYNEKTYNLKNGSVQQQAVTTNGYASAIYVSFDSDADFSANLDVRDKAAPDIPITEIDYKDNGVTFNVSNDVQDHGTNYQFKFVATDDTTGDIYQQYETSPYLNLSGLKGFYYCIDTQANKTVTKTDTFTKSRSIDYPYDYKKTMYLHIASVDNEGNLSDTFTIDIQPIAEYKVIYYIQNEDGTYEKQEVTYTDIIGKTVTPELPTFTGRDTPPSQSAVVKGDGSTVLEYYYDVTRFNVNGSVSWNDHENLYGTRPDDIGLTIYRDGEYFDYITVPVPDTVNKYSFPAIQKYDLETGREFEYTVEQDVAYSQAALENTEDKYTTIKKGFDFYNGIRNTEKPVEPGYPDEPENPDDKGLYVEGDIYWDDNDDSLGFRPSQTTITLYQKGEDGEWKVFGDPIVVDAKNDNHYIFDWLPKYWYDENDVPTAYEYKVEETFTSWYVEDGEIKNIYTIVPDTPKDCDFTNVFNFPDKPIIPVNEYTNTIIVKTNTDEQVRIILKPLELFIYNDYSVSYGGPTGNDIPVMTDKTGTSVKDLPGTRYEIVLDSPDYTLEDIKLSLAENMELEKIDGKWYVTIKNVPEDIIGTLEVELSPKENFYQDRQRFMNYFAIGLKAITKEFQEYSVMKMSDTVVISDPETEDIPDIIETTDSSELTDNLTIIYMDSDTEDLTNYSVGDEVEIINYLGKIPTDSKFVGWAKMPASEKVDYFVDDTIIIKESLKLYPVFINISSTEDVEDFEDFESEMSNIISE